MNDAVETVVEQAIARIREAIRDGRYAQGQRLIIADVTKGLGISAGPIREALRRLSGEGLIEIEPHRGASVKSFKREDIREIYQAREVIEGLAARLAAENVARSPDKAEFESSLEEARQIIVTRGGDYIKHNKNFHELIYRIGGNERVREIATQLTLPLYQLGAQHTIDPSQYRSRAAEHELIAEAILEGDARRAEQLMRTHVRISGQTALDDMEARAQGPRKLELGRPQRK